MHENRNPGAVGAAAEAKKNSSNLNARNKRTVAATFNIPDGLYFRSLGLVRPVMLIW